MDAWFNGLGPGLQAVVTASWQAAVLAVIVLATQLAMGHWLSPRWRYALWSVVVIRLMMPVAPCSALSVFNLLRSDPVPVVVAVMPVPMPTVDGVTFNIDSSALTVTGATPAQALGMDDIALVVWLAGVALILLAIVAINVVLALRLRLRAAITDPDLLDLVESCKQELGVRREILLYDDPRIASPALAGVFRPTLLLPPNLLAELPRDELRFILLHELAHVKKHDIAQNWLLIVLSAVHWFNPVVWFAFARLRADRELARDAMVLNTTGTNASQAYGQTIIHALERITHPRLSNPALAGIGDGMGQLKRRLRMISLAPKRRPALTFIGIVLLATLAAIGLTDAAEPEASADDSEEQASVHDGLPDHKADLIGTWRTVEGSPDPVVITFVANGKATITDDPLPTAHYDYLIQEDQLLFTRDDERLEFKYRLTGDHLFMTYEENVTEFVRLSDRSLEDDAAVTSPEINASMRNLRNIGMAVHVYAANHEELLPPDLGATLPYVDRNSEWTNEDRRPATPREKARMYLSLQDQQTTEIPEVPTSEWINENSSYIYLGGGDLSLSAIPRDAWTTTVILHEKLDDSHPHPEFGRVIAVLMLDGHVELEPADQAEQLIATSRKTIDNRSIQIRYESRFLITSERFFEKAGIEPGFKLTPEGDRIVFLDDIETGIIMQAAQKDESALVMNVSLVIQLNGRKFQVSSEQKTSFLAGYSHVEQGNTIEYKPLHDVVVEGTVLKAEATVSADRRYVTATLHPTVTNLVHPIEKSPWAINPALQKLDIEVPKITKAEKEVSVSIPDKATLLLDVGTVSGPMNDHDPVEEGVERRVYLLIKPTIFEPVEGGKDEND